MDQNRTPRQKAHAVIIGINRYQDENIPNLNFARQDAEALYRALTNPNFGHIPPENVILLLDEEANQRKVRSALGAKLLRTLDDADMVYIYFAGHGSLASLAGAGGQEDTYTKYLAPSDASLKNIPGSAVSMEEVGKFLKWKQVKQAALILDCSFNGDSAGRSFQTTPYPENVTLNNDFLEELVGENRLVLSACQGNEAALELKNVAHGLFTYFLVEGLKGKADKDRQGMVSIDKLYEYLYPNVSHHAKKFGGSMHPLLRGHLENNVIFHYDPDADEKNREQRERANQLYALAQQAYKKGEIETVYQHLHEVLEIFPGEEKAQKILSILNEKTKREQIKERITSPQSAPGEAMQKPAQTETETGVVKETSQDITEEKKAPVDASEAPPEPKPAQKEKPGKRAKRGKGRRVATVLGTVLLIILLILIYTPELNKYEKTRLFETLDTSARPFRSAANFLSLNDAKDMIARNGFYERDWNDDAKGYANEFAEGQDDQIVLDFATVLMWQKSGSEIDLTFEDALKYVEQLNRDNFAGYSDWRLPTLEEALCLVENKMMNGDLHIDPIFSRTQRRIWTADSESETRRWVVYFYDGYCYPNDIRYKINYVRAVR